MSGYKVIGLSKEKQEEAINGFSQMKPVLQQQCLNINLDGQGEADSKELGEHFDTAIHAMFTILAFMEIGEKNK